MAKLAAALEAQPLNEQGLPDALFQAHLALRAEYGMHTIARIDFDAA